MKVGDQVKLSQWFLKTRCKGGPKKHSDYSNAQTHHNDVGSIYQIDDDHNLSNIANVWKVVTNRNKPVIWVQWNSGSKSWYFLEEIDSIPVEASS